MGRKISSDKLPKIQLNDLVYNEKKPEFHRLYPGFWWQGDKAALVTIKFFDSSHETTERDSEGAEMMEYAHEKYRDTYPNKPNLIVKLLGLYNVYHTDALVLEYSCGTLFDFLEQTRSVPWHLIYQLAFDIAKGVNFLHSLDIGCLQLNTKNIFLYMSTNRLRAKLGNFKSSKNIKDSSKDVNISHTEYSRLGLEIVSLSKRMDITQTYIDERTEEVTKSIIASRMRLYKANDIINYSSILRELKAHQLSSSSDQETKGKEEISPTDILQFEKLIKNCQNPSTENITFEEILKILRSLINSSLPTSETFTKINIILDKAKQQYLQEEKRIALSQAVTNTKAPIISSSEFECDQEEKLGIGGCAVVCRGVLFRKKEYQRVAVKLVTLDEKSQKSLEHEARIMRYLNKISKSSLIMNALGLVTVDGQYGLVMEEVFGYNLVELLLARNLPWDLRYRLALDIANALHLLHSNNILHLDLRGANIFLFMINNFLVAKLGDFGQSRTLDVIPGKMEHIGTKPWKAPEMMSDKVVSKATDIYAFGCVLTELSTRQEPFKGVRSDTIAIRVVCGGERPTQNEDCPKKFQRLIDSCLAFNPEERPAIETIQRELTLLIGKNPIPAETLKEVEVIQKAMEDYRNKSQPICDMLKAKLQERLEQKFPGEETPLSKNKSRFDLITSSSSSTITSDSVPGLGAR